MSATARHLAATLGLVLRRDLSEDERLEARMMLRSGELQREAAGIYRPRDVSASADVTASVLLLRGPSSAVLTGERALALHGVNGTDPAASPEILVPHRSGPHADPRLVRTARMPRAVLRLDREGRCWPVAPPARALADVVARLDLEPARAMLGGPLRDGLVTPRQVHHELTAERRVRGPVVATLARDLGRGGTW